MVQGTTHQGINVRKTPKVEASNIDRAITAGVDFSGDLVTGLDGKQWIELSKLGGVPVENLYIASWVVNHRPVVTPPAEAKYPESFILTDPSTGVKTEYKFVRVLE